MAFFASQASELHLDLKRCQEFRHRYLCIILWIYNILKVLGDTFLKKFSLRGLDTQYSTIIHRKFANFF